MGFFSSECPIYSSGFKFKTPNSFHIVCQANLTIIKPFTWRLLKSLFVLQQVVLLFNTTGCRLKIWKLLSLIDVYLLKAKYLNYTFFFFEAGTYLLSIFYSDSSQIIIRTKAINRKFEKLYENAVLRNENFAVITE